MKNSKLLTLLEHLVTEELKGLDLYLQSPFFIEERNKKIHEKAYKLFLYLTKVKNNSALLKKEELFEYIYPNDVFSSVKINQLMAYLVKKTERFIVYIRENNKDYVNEIRQKQVMLDFYMEKKMKRWYEAQKRDIQKLQMQISFRNANYYLQQFLLECSYAKLVSIQTNRKESASLNNIVDSLEHFYELSLLEIACLAKESFTFDDRNLSLIESNLMKIKKDKADWIPTIEIYHYALQLISGNRNDEIFQQYKVLFMEYYDCFSVNQAKNLFTYALNYCAIQLNSGKEEYYEECWKMYCLGFEKSILYVEKKILPSDLKNIITLSLRLEKYEWAEQFLHKHKNKIEAENPKEVYSFNLANVFFYQQKYDDMHKILRILKCKDIFYELAMRRLEIKALYEEEEVTVLDAKLNAYRVFIHRNGVLDRGSKEMNNNFLNVLNKLLKIIPRDAKQITSLEQFLAKTPKLAERKWIVAKLEALK